ncbi:MAG: 30S ribosomal protein S16 [Mycoplasmataceae bacterium RV_VA103A]|nr:MAG: 30S ribosomal protein S16 [Mycoplasmataceae bacterium RV_VA103A]
MVKIRLSLKGRKGQHSFWIIAIDEKEPRDSGNYLEYLGCYDPRSKEIKLDKDNIKKWLSQGAQPTDTVKSLFQKYL